MSYGNTFTEFNFKNGIDIISSINGSGKSALMETIFYGLYGKAYRKVKNSALVNDINKKELVTIIKFKIEPDIYEIKRGMNPSILEIHKNDVLIPQEASIKKYQEMIETNILKVNELSFRQLIMLGANITNSKPFLELQQSEKEDIFNTVINTSIFTRIQETIKNKLNLAKTIEIDTEYKLDLLQNSLLSEETNIDKIKETNKGFEENNKDKILDLEVELTELEQKISKIEKVQEKLAVFENILLIKEEKKKEITKLQKENNNNILLYTEKIKHIDNLKSTHKCCIGCKNLSKISNIDITERGITSFKLGLCKDDVPFIEDDYNNIIEEIKNIKEKVKKSEVVIGKKSILEKRILQIKKEKEVLKEHNHIEIDYSNYEKLKNDIKETENVLIQTKENISNLVLLKKIILNKDLKGIIINKRLPILNKLINEYLEKFNFSEFSMIIDNTFKEKIVTSRGVQKEFNQLSNGQKFRLTQSLIFAFLKFTELKNAVKTNLLIADEVLDTSLDVNGREDLLKILEEDFGNKNIIIITHNADIKSKEEIFNRTINISKINNFSKIEIYESRGKDIE